MRKLKFCVHGLNQPYHHYDETDFILHENVWDDFCYRTTYSIVATPRLLHTNYSYEIGMISIIRKGQDEGKNVLSDYLLGKECLIEELPKDFVSISRDSMLCKRLFCILTPEERDDFISSLHFILGDDVYMEIIRIDKCFNTSVLRNIDYSELLDSLRLSSQLMRSELNGKELCENYMKLIENK